MKQHNYMCNCPTSTKHVAVEEKELQEGRPFFYPHELQNIIEGSDFIPTPAKQPRYYWQERVEQDKLPWEEECDE